MSLKDNNKTITGELFGLNAFVKQQNDKLILFQCLFKTILQNLKYSI